MSKDTGKELRGGMRLWHEDRPDGRWFVQETRETARMILMGEYYRESKRCFDAGLPPPPVPPGIDSIEPEEVVCIRRHETRVDDAPQSVAENFE